MVPFMPARDGDMARLDARSAAVRGPPQGMASGTGGAFGYGDLVYLQEMHTYYHLDEWIITVYAFHRGINPGSRRPGRPSEGNHAGASWALKQGRRRQTCNP